MDQLIASPTEALAQHLKAAGDETRLLVLQILGKGAFGVLELCDILQMTQPRLSHHLKLLTQARWISPRREGNALYYRRLPSHQAPILEALFKYLDQLPLETPLSNGLERIENLRAQKAQEFFAKQPDALELTEDLIAGVEDWSDQLEQILDTLELPTTAVALEVGCGEGKALPILHQRFSTLYALERSERMIDKSKALATQYKLPNIHYLCEDFLNPSQPLPAVDLILSGMVLHHLPKPERFFLQAFNALKTNGQLVLIELMQHDQNWAQDRCGDLWMGFETSELDLWATAAGFTPNYRLHAGLRTGFQIQTLVYAK